MVQLRDGKAYDPSASEPAASGGGSRRRQSTAAASAAAPSSAAQRATRRSTRLASAAPEVVEDPNDNRTSLQQRFEAASTPARAKRARPQQQTPAAGAAAAAPLAEDEGDELLNPSDLDSFDQGLQEAADMELPPDEPSPSQMHASKKARRPSTDAATPSSAAKAAKAAAAKLRKEVGGVTLVAASMVLLAAVVLAAFLPQAEPHRAALRGAVRASVLHTHEAVLTPLQAHLSTGLASAGARLAAGRDTARQVLDSSTAASQRQLRAAMQQAREQWARLTAALADLSVEQRTRLQALIQKARTAAAAATTSAFGSAWSPAVLAGILPPGPAWADLAADMSELLRTAPAARSNKAPAAVLACGSPQDCDAAAAALSALPPRGAACVLSLDAAADLQPAGHEAAAVLQAALAPFLARCPAGLVVLRGAEALPLAALPALHTALSELGSFQHDGHVDGTGAAYVLLTQLAAEQVAAAAASPGDGDGAAQDGIKEAWFGLMRAALQAEVSATASEAMSAAAAQGEADDEALQARGAEAAERRWGAASRALTTLHRRIEFAAPVRLSTPPAAAAAA